jgi:hypothetical protein
MQMVDVLCRHAPLQFQTKIIFPAVKQGLILAQQKYETCSYLNQQYNRNLVVMTGADCSTDK